MQFQFQFAFWLIVFFIVYTYAGYPLILWVLSNIKRQKIDKSKDISHPTVSIVIAAKNEENTIERRLNNLFSVDYPCDKLEIIVVSDGSCDRTTKILDKFNRELQGNRIGENETILKSISYTSSMGKPYAINKGVSVAAGEIILFSDSRQIFEPEAIRELVANFNDPEIGCVSGKLVFKENFESDIYVEMGAYWKYEKWIRKLESATGSVVGATGAIYAIRRKLYKSLPIQTLLDDVLTPMNIVMQGYRVIFDPAAIAYDTMSKDMNQERQRKLRTLAGNWQLFSIAPELFLPWGNPLFWRLVSHKVSRLIVPFLLPVMLVLSLLCRGSFYQFVVWLQILFYLTAVMGGLMPRLRKIRIVNLSYFFCAMNLAAVGGFFIWCSGRCKNAWKANNSQKKQKG